MEQLNKVELRGNIGSVRCSEYGDRVVVNFTMATTAARSGKYGKPLVDTTWHVVNAWQNRSMPDLKLLAKGMPVSVTGRIRSNRFTGADGVERTSQEIQAYSLRIEEESMRAENLL